MGFWPWYSSRTRLRWRRKMYKPNRVICKVGKRISRQNAIICRKMLNGDKIQKLFIKIIYKIVDIVIIEWYNIIVVWTDCVNAFSVSGNGIKTTIREGMLQNPRSIFSHLTSRVLSCLFIVKFVLLVICCGWTLWVIIRLIIRSMQGIPRVAYRPALNDVVKRKGNVLILNKTL